MNAISSSIRSIGDGRLRFFGVADSDPYFGLIDDKFESGFARFCASYLRDTDVALDIGANIGITAAIMALWLKRGHIHAFEPAPSVFDVLKLNLDLNAFANITAHQLALSDRAGEVRFLSASAYGHISDDQRAQAARATTVDEFVRTADLPRLDFMKIDVEGFERQVLAGGAATIERFQPLIYLEFNSWALTAYGKTNTVEFAEWLLGRFSHVFLVNEPSSKLVRIGRADAASFAQENMTLRGCVDNLVVTNDPSRLNH